MSGKHPTLELKTRPKFCPVSSAATVDDVPSLGGYGTSLVQIVWMHARIILLTHTLSFKPVPYRPNDDTSSPTAKDLYGCDLSMARLVKFT